jgi:alcohol dehydrogenase class IV
MQATAVARIEAPERLILLGEGAAGGRLAAELSRADIHAVGLVASRSATAAGHTSRLREIALADCEVKFELEGLQPGTPVSALAELAKSVEAEPVDAVIAIGGGSAIDTGKGLALALAADRPIGDYFVEFQPPDRMIAPELPPLGTRIVAIPTTLSGAEVTPSAGFVADSGGKRLIRGLALAPRIVCADPEILAATPVRWLHATGMCALGHCVEALYATGPNPVSSALALEGAERLGYGLRAAVAGQQMTQEHAAALGAGSVLAGLAMATVRSSLQHAVAQVLGGQLGLMHGDAHSVMLPSVMRFNLEATQPAQLRFTAALARGLGEAAPSDPPAYISLLRARLVSPSSLQKLGVRQEEMVDVAAATFVHPGAYANPRPIAAAEELVPVLEAAW